MFFNFKLQHLIAVILVQVVAFLAGFATGESSGMLDGYKKGASEMHFVWSGSTQNGSRSIPNSAYELIDNVVVDMTGSAADSSAEFDVKLSEKQISNINGMLK